MAKAKEVVITNTNKIADMIEKISPVHPDKCPPVIPKSDETLTNICYDKAHEIYGPDLPEIVEERLQRELNSIICQWICRNVYHRAEACVGFK